MPADIFRRVMTSELDTAMPLKALSGTLVRRSCTTVAVTFDTLDEGRARGARAIILYGEKFLPIFERLDRECEARWHPC